MSNYREHHMFFKPVYYPTTRYFRHADFTTKTLWPALRSFITAMNGNATFGDRVLYNGVRWWAELEETRL